MAGRLALVPEFGELDRDTYLSPPRDLSRYGIRNVAVFRRQYRRQSAHSGSSYSHSHSHSHSSGASSSHCSSASASTAATAEFSAHDDELAKIAREIASDGYGRSMVNAFGSGDPDRALETWFLELDVDWVLQIHEEHGLRRELQFKSAASLQELIERWIRALTIIAVSMVSLVMAVSVDETPAVARFCKASMANMLVFVDAIIPALKEEKLRSLVHIYVCVSSATALYRYASYWFTQLPIYSESHTILDEIDRSLSREVISLREAISSTMDEVRTFVENDDSWAISIPQGRGEVHRNTRLMVDCITSMIRAEGSLGNTAQSHDSINLRGLIDDSVHYLKDLLLRKSEHSSDLGLRYLFLLINFCSVAQLSEPRPGDSWVLTPECKIFMDSYLDVSWGRVLSHIQKTVFKDSCLHVSCRHVLFCIPKAGFHEWCQHRKRTSSLAKFESAFHRTYQAQKLWKVPDPQLRDMLRKIITERVISDYRCYLQKHPELDKHVSSSPDELQEMLGELFEG